jgi:hypothetical protein
MKTTIEVSKARSFGGKINNFTDKQERAFEKAHLKAYLRGDKMFNFGFIDHPVTGQRIPAMHAVKEGWR